MRKIKFFAVTLLFALWWGGFTFYAAVVVPQGMKILGDHIKMGMITRSVTNYINVIGSVVLVISLVFLMVNRNKEKNFSSAVGWELPVLVLLQLVLFYVHHILVSMIHTANAVITLEDGFYTIHRVYLLTSTAMWLVIPLLYYRLIRPFI